MSPLKIKYGMPNPVLRFTLSEFLTKNRHKTFLLARERFGISQGWTRNENIIVCGAGGLRHHGRSIVDVDSITNRSADVPISDGLTASVPPNKEKTVVASTRSRRTVKK